MMNDPHSIRPFQQPVRGAVALPGSKSITNRALVLATLAEGTTSLTGVLFSRDTDLMLAALDKIGVGLQIDRAARTVTVEGTGGVIPVSEASLEVGNAGTAARFLPALLAMHPGGRFFLDGDPAMRDRPMAALLDSLVALGAEVVPAGQPGHLPFTLRSQGLRGGHLALDASASSQFVSALLMATPYADAPTRIEAVRLRPAFIRITVAMMAQFGVEVTGSEEGVLEVPANRPYRSPGVYAIEPDVSAASYFMALPLVTGGTVSLPGLPLNSLQGDAAFEEIVRALGGDVQRGPEGWRISANAVEAPGLDRDFSHFSDTFLTLAAIAPLLRSTTTIRGIAHTRAQETDRVEAMATELRKTGCRVETTDSSITIHPDRGALRQAAAKGVQIETYEDHRIAMSFAILGCADLGPDHQPWLHIHDPLCCRKTFPDFFEKLASLHPAGDHRSLS